MQGGERARGAGLLVFAGLSGLAGGFGQLQGAERDRLLVADGEEPMGDDTGR